MSYARTVSAAAIALLAITASTHAQIINGNFESGNTGFTSDYAFRVVSDGSNVHQYGVTHTSFEWTQFWSTITADHTTGTSTGLFLIADVGPSGAIWQQTVAVSQNTSYDFGAWLSTWTPFTPATLAVEINGTVITNWTGPAGATWTQYSTAWNSGASSSAIIRLYATSFFQPGDDIAIDDITLVAVPAPASASLILSAAALSGRRRRR